MERIGIASSKIAKGNLFLYNACVFFLAFLTALLLFLLAGSAIFLGLWIIRLVFGPLIPAMGQGEWNLIFCYSLTVLTALVAMVALAAVLKNVRFKK